jgi:hypothetical protein
MLCEEMPCDSISISSIVFLRRAYRLIVTANVVPSSPILVTLMMEELSSANRRFLQGPHRVTSQKTCFLTSHLNFAMSFRFLTSVLYNYGKVKVKKKKSKAIPVTDRGGL